jgi:hypothetical protein
LSGLPKPCAAQKLQLRLMHIKRRVIGGPQTPAARNNGQVFYAKEVPLVAHVQ